MQNRAHSKGRTPPDSSKEEKAVGAHTDKSVGISILNKKAGIWQTDEHGQVKFREISPVRRHGIIASGQREKTKQGRERNSHRSTSNPEVEFVAAALGAVSRTEERSSHKRKESYHHRTETEGKTTDKEEILTEQGRGKSLVLEDKRSKEFDGEKLYQQVQQKKAQLSEAEQQHSGSKSQGGKPKADIGYHSNPKANQWDLSSAGNRGKIEPVYEHPRKEGRSEGSVRNDLNQVDTVGGSGGQIKEFRQGYGATGSINNHNISVVNGFNNLASTGGGSSSSDTVRAIADKAQSKDTTSTHQNYGTSDIQRGVVRWQGSNHRRGRRQERQDYQRRVERDRRFLPKEKSRSPRIRRSLNQRKPTGLFEGHVKSSSSSSGRITQNEDGQRGEPVGGVLQSHKPQKPDSGRHLSKAEVSSGEENKGKERENRTAVRDEVVAGERKHYPVQQTERRHRTNNQETSSVKSEPYRPVPKPRFIIPPPSEVEPHQTTSPRGTSKHLYSQSQKQTSLRKESEPNKSDTSDVKLKESHIGSGGHLSRLKTEVNKKTSLSAIPEGENNHPGLRVKTQPRFQKNQQGERKKGERREGERSPVPTRALHKQQHYRRATGRYAHQEDRERTERVEKQRNIKSSNKQSGEPVASHKTNNINNLNRQRSATLDREGRLSPDHNQERHSFGLPRRAVSYSSLLSPSDDSLTKKSGNSPPSSRSDIGSDPESSRLFLKSDQPKIFKYHQKTNLKQQKRISQSQTNLSKICTSGKDQGSSFFRKIGSQLDLRILKVLSPRKGSSRSKEESSTISTDSSSGGIRGEHRPQIRSPRYNPPSPSSPTFHSGGQQPQSIVDNTILTSTSRDPDGSTDSEMYRRVTTSYQREFDDVRLRRSFDLGRDLPERPQSAMFFSQGDLPDFLEGAPENHFRPRSESDVDISKLAAINRSRSGDRIVKVERSSSPNPYDNRTLEGGSKPPRLSPEGMDAYFGNLLVATKEKSINGSSKNQVNLNIKRAESAAENNPSQYRDYDKWDEEAPIPKNSSPEENFASNQPKVYRPSKDEVKHSPQPARRTLKQHLHDKSVFLQSGEILEPSTVTVVPAKGDSDRINPSRPASLDVPPFPEDSYVPLERLPSKPQHKAPKGQEETQKTESMTSPQEEIKGVPVGQKVNNSINMKQGKHKAKLGQVPAISERNNPPTDVSNSYKKYPIHINNPLSETSDYIDSEPSDSPPPLPKVQYVHVDPRKSYNTTENVAAEDYQHYLEPDAPSELGKLRKTPIKTWDYSSDSSKGTYLSDSDDSSDSECLKPGLGQPTPQKRKVGIGRAPPLPVRKAPPLPVRQKETARFSDANGPETRHTELVMAHHYEQRIGGQHQSKGQIRGKKLPNATSKPDKKEQKRRKSETVIRKGPDEMAKQRQAARPISDVRDNRNYNTPFYTQSLPRPPGKNPPSHKREASLDMYLSDKGEEDGFRAVGSPGGRSGRDRRKQQQKMLSSGGNMVKMPRQPRPKRMKVILEYLSKGVVNCIELNKQKLEHMKQQLMEGHAQGRTSQGLQYNLEKVIKTTERHLRKLEFHLAKVEELQEQYEKELKVRDGGENILRAFSEANSSKAKGSVSEAKQQVKDCTQNMCHLEAELEVNLGVFIMKIEGIAGFARVCRGDVFEISFKYGFQKWKSKCKVEKDLSQTWENAEVMFYPMLADYLQIKVTEIRGIARSNIIIGSLEFDTSDFYQAEPQNLTIDVNEAGTIKLNVVISWSPFQIVEEEMKILNKNSYSRRERSLTESSLPNYRPQSVVVPPPLSSKPEAHPTNASVPVSVSVDLDDVPMLTLAESLHNVNKLLEILHGQYVELKTLEKQVNSLESHLKKKSNIDRQGSMSSLSIKNALDSFSFLDDVDEGLSDGEGDLTEQTNSQNLAEKSTSVPKSKSLDHLQFAASKTDKDSHISASRPDLRTAQRQERPSAKRSSRFLDLSEKRESRMVEVNEQRSSGLLDSPTVDSSFGSLGRSSMDPEPEPLTTGSESIDMVLVQHLMYTEYQLSHLGAFGPLKLKESIALDKLQKQAVIIEQLVMLSSSGEELFRADDILPELKLNPALLEFWEQCSEKHALYVNADLFLLQLDVKFGVKLRTNHPDIADDVFQSLGHRIIERPIDLLDPKAIITLFQYITFFAQEDRKNPERFINDLTNEFELTASLEPGHADLPKIVKKLPKGVLLPTGNLRALGLLLLEESDTIKNGVRSYLESICNSPKARQKAIHVYAECLEERDLSLRQAGCVALAAMRAREKLEQLVYLLQCDMDDVKQTVKEALMTFGEEGRQAYESLSIQPYAYTQQQQHHKSDGPLLTTEL